MTSATSPVTSPVTSPSPSPSDSPVTVIGLGAMGRAIAQALVAAGHPTTVWNRSPARATELVEAGATLAVSPAAAVAASPLTLICVLDPPAVEAVLDATANGLDGADIVNLTSSGPEQAAALAARVTAAGGRYLDGKIMVPTPLVGTADGFVVYSGDRALFDRHQVTLRALGPDADHLGDDVELAAVHDLGMLDIFFNGMAAFVHAVALVGANGVGARSFLPYARRILGVLDVTAVELAAQIDDDNHHGDEDNLVMEAAAVAHIVDASRGAGVDETIPAAVGTVIGRALDAGFGADGFSRVIDVVRPAGTASAA